MGNTSSCSRLKEPHTRLAFLPSRTQKKLLLSQFGSIDPERQNGEQRENKGGIATRGS